MEEDIKILEEYIDFQKQWNLLNHEKALITAIENLIKGYKLEKLKNVLDEQSLKEALEDYIPKSKIKEKIEELNKEEKDLRNSISAEEYAEYSDANISFDLMHIEIQRSILQELMEDK